MTEFVAAKGVQTFRVGAGAAGAAGSFTPAPLSASAEPDAFEGFDGIGRGEEAYAPAEVSRPQVCPPSPHHCAPQRAAAIRAVSCTSCTGRNYACIPPRHCAPQWVAATEAVSSTARPSCVCVMLYHSAAMHNRPKGARTC